MTNALHALLDEPAIDREIVRRGGLYAYCQLAWPHVEGPGTPFVGGKHLELICAHLEAITRGELFELVINIPPGFSKSSLVSIMWPTWEWGPQGLGHLRYMAISFDQQVSLRDADKARRLLESEWYQARWGLTSSFAKPVALARSEPGKVKASAAKSFYFTNQQGMRMSTMFGGKGTGHHADRQIVDDPIKPADIRAGGDKARNALQKVRDIWSGTFASRKRGKIARVIVMQRLHSDDLAATCIADGYTHLCLPAEYDPERHCKTPWGEDWRTVKGELLCPQRVGVGDREAIERAKKDMGSLVYASQMQQNPTVDGGSVFRREWFTNRWTEIPSGEWWASFDCTFKKTGESDYVVGQVWCKSDHDFYLVDQVRARMTFTETVQAVEALCKKWPQVYRVLVEDKANGTAVMDTLKAKIPGLVPVEPKGGKEARANAVTTVFENKHVWFPDNAPWLHDLIEEFASFPLGRHDDTVDAATQAISDRMNNIAANRYARLAEALDAQHRSQFPTLAPRFVEEPGDVLVRTGNPALLGEQLKQRWAVIDAGGGRYAVRAGPLAEAARYAIQRNGWAEIIG